MAINAISGLSLYEYYYSINNKKDSKKDESPLALEMKKYGLKPTDNEALNARKLQEAKTLEQNKNADKNEEISYSDRPWADLMYQLDIQFNKDPKDDIDDIKEELSKLTLGLDDEELSKEVSDLENYVDKLYINFKGNESSLDTSMSLTSQLNNMALMNTFRLS